MASKLCLLFFVIHHLNFKERKPSNHSEMSHRSIVENIEWYFSPSMPTSIINGVEGFYSLRCFLKVEMIRRYWYLTCCGSYHDQEKSIFWIASKPVKTSRRMSKSIQRPSMKSKQRENIFSSRDDDRKRSGIGENRKKNTNIDNSG